MNKEQFIDYIANDLQCNIEDTENTLDIYTFFVDTLQFTQRGYNSFYKFVDRLRVNEADYEISFIYDTSGYDYWTCNMKESNYLHICVELKTDSVNLNEVYDKVIQIADTIEKWLPNKQGKRGYFIKEYTYLRG